ncbi:pancreatic triacylglycerol lipase-like isoform X2 [Stegodyphus dumicola]|uniref:pancreatic triacylglycerol lipase-like isoform X2 n=1 Tax=Stegodyphus dumicola TaxID=202533 RepID=UPI0015B365AA|nr:pancreatic triacylglycerol lipase-like isoform X2 [Stegodyphus dumicola]
MACLFFLTLAASLVYLASGDFDVISHLTRNKCMTDLGCFNAGPPFFDLIERPLSLLPEDRESINTKFFLYTRSNHDTPRNFSNMDFSTDDLHLSMFSPNARTKFIVPGYISRTSEQWKIPLKDALLFTEDCNVFLVDWSGGDGPLYEQAVANTRVVGAELALFIKTLQNLGIQPESIHIIGHSLGSHIAGYAGKRLKRLGRITAMDPAGPYFTNVDPIVRLDRADALLVDAIHTNAAATRFQGFGLTESIGHFDFFPNGGHLQPGCQDMGHAILSFITKHPTFDEVGLSDLQCNHRRAIELFKSSITGHCELMGVLCDSWDSFNSGKCGTCSDGAFSLPMGLHLEHFSRYANPKRSLNFYLNTTDSEPYCV